MPRRDLHERYHRFHQFVISDGWRPCLRALWPMVFLIIVIVAFAKAKTGKDLADILQAPVPSHGPAPR